jgi:hypothetical protein
MEDIISLPIKKHDKLGLIMKRIVDQCHIDQNKYYVLGSYPLREHRSINDMDVIMFKNEFDKLQKCAPYGKIETYNNQIRWFYDMTDTYRKLVDPEAKDFSIEIYRKEMDEGYPNKDFSLASLLQNKRLQRDMFGHQHLTLEALLEGKKITNRPKDQADIELLIKLLGKKDMSAGYYHKYMKYRNKYYDLKSRFQF